MIRNIKIHNILDNIETSRNLEPNKYTLLEHIILDFQKIGHWSNMCTNVIKVSHFDYTRIINIGWPHSKNIYIDTPHFQVSYLSHYLSILKNLKSFGCISLRFIDFLWSIKTKRECRKSLKSKMQAGLTCG